MGAIKKSKILLWSLLVFVLIMPLSLAGSTPVREGICVNVEITDINPSSVGRNEDFTVGIQLQNCGDKPAEDITLELKYTEPDILIKEKKTIYVESMRVSSHQKFFLYHMRTSPNATPGEHIIEMELKYQLSPKAHVISWKNFTITITGDPADLDIAYVKTDPIIPKINEEVTLTIRIENFGDGKANSVKANIDLPFFGIKESFLGTLEADDDGPAVFTLRPNDSGNFDYNLQISYKDDYGVHTITENLTLVIEGNEKNDSLRIRIIIAVLIILAGIGCYFYFKQKKKTGG